MKTLERIEFGARTPEELVQLLEIETARLRLQPRKSGRQLAAGLAMIFFIVLFGAMAGMAWLARTLPHHVGSAGVPVSVISPPQEGKSLSPAGR